MSGACAACWVAVVVWPGQPANRRLITRTNKWWRRGCGKWRTCGIWCEWCLTARVREVSHVRRIWYEWRLTVHWHGCASYGWALPNEKNSTAITSDFDLETKCTYLPAMISQRNDSWAHFMLLSVRKSVRRCVRRCTSARGGTTVRKGQWRQHGGEGG